MNKYIRFAVTIISIEFIILVFGNFFYQRHAYTTDDRLYRVEASRIADELTRSELADIDLSGYKTIIDVKKYRSEVRCDYDYVIEDVEGVLYQISYISVDNNKGFIILNVSIGACIVITILILTYIGKKVIHPFKSMSHMSYELAKGNLTVPIKEEKSKFFGKFLWGMDMLRETLEENKIKELTLQKEKKLMVLSLSHDIKTPREL